jgi:hypothetical protein
VLRCPGSLRAPPTAGSVPDSVCPPCRAITRGNPPVTNELLMKSFDATRLNISRSYNSTIWMTTAASSNAWHTEVYIRATKSIHYHAMDYRSSRPSLTNLYYDTYLHGVFSPRPYHLGQPYDASTRYCLLALFEDCCKRRFSRDPRECLTPLSCAREIVFDFDLIREQALWEGLQPVPLWDETNTDALLTLLSAAGCRALGDALRIASPRP